MGERKKRMATKMPQETSEEAIIMSNVKANLETVPEEEPKEYTTTDGIVMEKTEFEKVVETVPEEVKEAVQEEMELPEFNWLKVPPGGVDMRSMKLFTPGGESYRQRYDEFIDAGYKVKSLSVNENVVYYLFELCK